MVIYLFAMRQWFAVAVRRGCLNLCSAALVLATTVTCLAEPVLPGIQRIYEGDEASSAEAGRLLMAELNCVACHQPSDELAAVLRPKQSPLLDGVTSRAWADHLMAFIADPHGTKPGTTMPNVLGQYNDEQRRAAAEAMVHYLASLSPAAPEQSLASIGSSERGNRLYHSVGCVACHGSRQEETAVSPYAKPLGDLAGKYTLPTLSEFLRDPLHVRPSGRMPNLNLSQRQASDIASFLLPDIPEGSALVYSYYEGSWNSLPNFNELEPVTTGDAEVISVGPKQRGNQFGLVFEGVFALGEEGEYTLHIGSDDGGRIQIDGQTIAEYTGVRAYSVSSGKAQLGAGRHSFRVEYYEASGQERLDVEIEGLGLQRQPLHGLLAPLPEHEEQLRHFEFTPNPELVDQGRVHFTKLGCAACHSLHENDSLVLSELAAPSLATVRAVGEGCLADSPGHRPDYSLTSQQRTAVTAAMEEIKGGSEDPTPAQIVHQTMTAMNCYACHERGEFGGMEEETNSYFQTTQPEMGDEGRVPPSLTGVGGKLTREWMTKILSHGADDRPYMLTVMPNFGGDNLVHLIDALEELDQLEPLPDVEFTETPREVRLAGWEMVGAQGFSCIKCHTFGQLKAEGIQSIDLQIMTERLRPEWFVRYMRNPQVFRSGTRMPSAWPVTGPSLLSEFFEGDCDQQIAAVWEYLDDGSRALVPNGLVTGSLDLVPIRDAIIYRNFIQGAGPRAIGVGYPESNHLAFDAENLRLALLWQGRFIDARQHWNGRGQGFCQVAGDNKRQLPDIVSFALLADVEQDSWPTDKARELGYRFRGYRLTEDQRPTFLYDVAGVRVEDFPSPVEGEGLLRREIALTAEEAPPENLYYLAARHADHEELDDGWHRFGDLEIKIEGAPSDPILRESRGQWELLIPVVWEGGKCSFVHSYKW